MIGIIAAALPIQTIGDMTIIGIVTGTVAAGRSGEKIGAKTADGRNGESTSVGRIGAIAITTTPRDTRTTAVGGLVDLTPKFLSICGSIRCFGLT